MPKLCMNMLEKYLWAIVLVTIGFCFMEARPIKPKHKPCGCGAPTCTIEEPSACSCCDKVGGCVQPIPSE